MKGEISFGTDGWRGVMADDFTFASLSTVAHATARFFLHQGEAASKGVSVGYDTRFLSDLFAQEVAGVMARNGIPVRLSSSHITTPALSWDVVSNGSAWGIMITASHNPCRFNGFKIKTSMGTSADEKVTREIEKLLCYQDRMPGEETKAPVDMVDMRTPYLQRVSELVDWERVKGVVSSVVSDPLYGAVQGDFLSLLGSNASLKTKGIHLCLNPAFGGLDPEPIPRNLGPLMQEVLANSHPSVGVAQDGDGDRLGMVDEDGRWVSPHQVLSLLLLYLVQDRGMRGQVVKSFSTTMLVEHICEDMGLDCVETGIGFKYIAPRMLEKPTLLAGEESGGVAFGFHIPERDGILAGLMVLEMLGHWGLTLKDALKRLERRYGSYFYKRMDIAMPVEKGKDIVETMASSPPERLGGFAVTQVRKKDGVKFVMSNGSWLLVRASGTEPLLRLYAEARREREVDRILDDGDKACRAAVSR